MTKMLIANDLLRGGGVEKLMHDFVMSWYKEYEITILTEHKDSEFTQLYPASVRYLHYHPRNRLGHIHGLRKLNELLIKLHRRLVFMRINRKAFDIAIAMKEGWITKYISKSKARVRLSWVHVDYFNAYWTKSVFSDNKQELDCMKAFQNIICVSEAIKKSILSVIGDPGNLVVRYNPIDARKILDLSLEPIDGMEENLPEGKTLFVSIGRLHYQKGYDLLMKACARLEREGLDYELWLIGSGIEEQNLKNCLLEEKNKNIKLLGEKNNPYSLLRYASWFISSSRYEGYSLVSQEAAVLEIPIIATDCSGVRELLGENGEYGIITEITAEGLFLAMKQVIENPALHKIYQEKIRLRTKMLNYEDRMMPIRELLHG